jgi:hypothetical protein
MATSDDRTALLLRRSGEPWRAPSVTAYENERGLQDLLVESPHLIPGVERAAAVDELGIPAAGSVDLLAVSPEADLTLVECKLGSNPEIRRAVVGQVLAYAGGLWKLDYAELDEAWTSRAGRSLAESVRDVLPDTDTLDGWSTESFEAAVGDRLATGDFRLVIAVDRITNELKRIVEYLNVHTSDGIEVFALELDYLRDGDVELLVPRQFGEETARLKPKKSVERTEARFFSALAECAPGAVDAIRMLRDWSVSAGAAIRVGGTAYPTMRAILTVGGTAVTPWTCNADPSAPAAPRLAINFGSLRNALAPDRLELLAARLAALPGAAERLGDVRNSDWNRFPAFPLNTALADDDAVTIVVSALAEALGS